MSMKNSRSLEHPDTPEARLDAFVRATTRTFTLAEACEAAGGTVEAIGREVRSILTDELFAFTAPEEADLYFSRQAFFADKTFRMTRFQFEIAEKVLIPGGRAAAFCHPSILPSEMKLFAPNGKPLPRKTIRLSIEDAAAYYNLLGSEEMFHYFEADHIKNTEVLLNGDPEGIISLDVFSTAPLGHPEAVLFRVKNWMDGEFFVEPASAADFEKSPAWLKDCERALCHVFEDRGYYIEIPEQLMQSLWHAPKILESEEPFETDRLLASSDLIEIIYVGSRTLLWRNDEDKPNPDAVPEGITVSSGNIDSPDAILAELKCPITNVEITAEMYDECYRGNMSFQNVYGRLFNDWELPFADDAQEAYLQNFLEAEWEDVCDDYDRVRDDLPGKVRHFALAVNHERLRWLAQLEKSGVAPNAEQAEILMKMSEMYSPLLGLLQLLNQHEVFSDETEPDRIIEAITQLADSATVLIQMYERAGTEAEGHQCCGGHGNDADHECCGGHGHEDGHEGCHGRDG